MGGLYNRMVIPMTKDIFTTNLADILGASKTALVDDARLRDFKGWDSMGQMAVLTLIDTDVGVQVPLNWIGKCETVGEIMRLVDSHLEK